MLDYFPGVRNAKKSIPLT